MTHFLKDMILFVPNFDIHHILNIDDDEVPLPRQGGQRRHGEDRHTKGTRKMIYFFKIH